LAGLDLDQIKQDKKVAKKIKAKSRKGGGHLPQQQKKLDFQVMLMKLLLWMIYRRFYFKFISKSKVSERFQS